jgi:hypothetical protein
VVSGHIHPNKHTSEDPESYLSDPMYGYSHHKKHIIKDIFLQIGIL